MNNANNISDGKGNMLTILGTVGLKYSNNEEDFFVDSELLDGDEYDIAVF